MKIELRILNKEFYRSGKVLDSSNSNLTVDSDYHIVGLPKYATLGSAAMDLICTKDVTIYPQERALIHTGLAVWIGSDAVNPPGWVNDMGVAGLILPRSGLGTKGLVLANTIGVIDEDYQGELMVSAWNSNALPDHPDYNIRQNRATKSAPEHGYGTIQLKAGDRFAQLMFVPFIKAEWSVVEEFSSSTKRGEGGFGHTG